MRTETILREEIESIKKEMQRYQIGSKEYESAVESLTKLVDRLNNLEKIQMESEHKHLDREMEERLREKEIKIDKRDRYLRNGAAIGGVILTAVTTMKIHKDVLKFDGAGYIFTSSMGKKLLNMTMPKLWK